MCGYAGVNRRAGPLPIKVEFVIGASDVFDDSFGFFFCSSFAPVKIAGFRCVFVGRGSLRGDFVVFNCVRESGDNDVPMVCIPAGSVGIPHDLVDAETLDTAILNARDYDESHIGARGPAHAR